MQQSVAVEFIPFIQEVGRHLIGKEQQIKLTLAAFLAKGHVLLEDVPGVGKTSLAKAFAGAMGLEYGRIQFTSDMLPSDIIGLRYFNQKSGDFQLQKGPIFTPFLLADEINRAMPKTQSALLEAMEERRVTIEGTSYVLAEHFFVIGTQNPYEEVGTFPLPHSQLDRFLCSFGIGYPDKESERAILQGELQHKTGQVAPCFTLEQIERYSEQVKTVRLSDAMLDYLQDLIAFTRESGKFVYGLSTRGALALTAMVKAWAVLHGRDYATPDDLQAVTPAVCSHRLRFVEGRTNAERVYDEIFTHIISDT